MPQVRLRNVTVADAEMLDLWASRPQSQCFVREGVQRGAQFRAGAFHDLVTYARTREDRAS